MMDTDTLNRATLAILDLGVKVLQGYRFAPTDEEHVAALLAYMAPPDGAVILDAGCGFGEVARLMHAERPDLDFILLNQNALQLSYAPVEFARKLGDFHHTSLPDQSVAGVMFLYSLCHGDPVGALTEAARVTKPGGFLFVYDYERTGGDNDLYQTRLLSSAIPRGAMDGIAAAAGWQIVMHANPEGDDALFRSLYGNDEEYDAIFRDLTPVVWKAIRT